MSTLFSLKINREQLDEEMRTMRIYPGATLPFKHGELEVFVIDVPASTPFPVDWSVTRWPEGAEL